MNEDKFILTDYIVFESKPDAVPYQYRLSYKIALASLILGLTCGRSGCSLTKLHLVIISMYSEKEKANLLNYVNGNKNQYLILRYDPTINKTVDFMLAEKIIFQQNNGLLRLTNTGKSFLNRIIDDKTLLVDEKKFLNKLSNNLTEDMIKKLTNSLLG